MLSSAMFSSLVGRCEAAQFLKPVLDEEGCRRAGNVRAGLRLVRDDGLAQANADPDQENPQGEPSLRRSSQRALPALDYRGQTSDPYRIVKRCCLHFLSSPSVSGDRHLSLSFCLFVYSPHRSLVEESADSSSALPKEPPGRGLLAYR